VKLWHGDPPRVNRWALIALDKRGEITPMRGSWVNFADDETGGNAHIVSDVRRLLATTRGEVAAIGIWRGEPPGFSEKAVMTWAGRNPYQALVRR
jgi:hypothetical protein